MKIRKLMKLLGAAHEVSLIPKAGKEVANYTVFEGDVCDVPFMYINQKVLKIEVCKEKVIVVFREES